jgi:hypothetical protein
MSEIVRISQFGGEVIHGTAGPSRVSQFGAEIILVPRVPSRVSQFGADVIQRIPKPFSILIDGVEHTMDARPYSLRVEYQLGARGQADLQVVDLDSFETAFRPTLDQRVELIINTLLFRGTIFNIKDSPLGAPGVGTVTTIGAVDDWARATTRRVSASYAEGTTLKAVVTDLVTTYLGLYNLQLDPYMLDGPALSAVTFDGVTVEDAFNQLVDLSGGWVYRLRPNGIIEWFAIGSKIRTFLLSAENENILGAITWTKSRSQFANRVCVRYGTGVVGKGDLWTGDGTTVRFTLSYPPLFPLPASNGWIAWVAYPAAGGQEGCGIDPANGFPWYYDAVTNQIVRSTPPTGAIAFTYNVQFPLVVCADAPVPAGSAAPQWRNYPPRGGNNLVPGYGDDLSDATPPTTVTAVASPGGTLEECANNQYGFYVTAFDASGRESHPYPFHCNPETGEGRGAYPATVSTLYGTQTVPTAVFTPGSDQITVSWSGATGAVKYRCYIGDWYYLSRSMAYIETTGTSCVWTSRSSGVGIDAGIHYYVVMAQQPEGGLTQVSTEMQSVQTGPSRPGAGRPIRGWFTPTVGAVNYFVCRRGTTGGFDRMIVVPPDQLEGGWVYFDDDLVDDGSVISGLPAAVVPWEGIVERADIFDTAEALAYAQSLVAKANALPRTVTLKTRVADDILPGDAIRLDVPSRTLPDALWLVTEVVLVTEADQGLTTTLTLLEGLQTQSSWIDFWRELTGTGAGVGIVSSGVAPPPVGGGGSGTGGVTNAGNLTAHSLILGQGGTILAALEPLGTTSTVLHGNASGDPSWGKVTPSDLSGPIPIAAGGTGQVTKATGFDALSPGTTKGDLVVFTGTTHVRQPVGADGLALVADAAEATGLKWAAVASGGGGGGTGSGGGGALVWLATQVGTGAERSLDFTSIITADYDEYVVEVLNVQPVTAGASICLQVSTDNGATWVTTSSYHWTAFNSSPTAGGVGTNQQSPGTAIVLWGDSGGTGSSATATPGLAMTFTIRSPLDPAHFTLFTGQGVGQYNPNGNRYSFTLGGWYAAVTPVTAFRVLPSAGNVVGTIRVYGLAKAASGDAGGGGALVLLEQHTAASSASLAFTDWYSADYDDYLIECINVLPATNGVDLLLRMSTNGGASYDAGANYGWATASFRSGAGTLATQGAETGQTGINLNAGLVIDTAAAWGGLRGSLRLFHPASTTAYKLVVGQTNYKYTGGAWNIISELGGSYQSTTAVNALQVVPTSGLLASGTIRIYGIAKTASGGGSGGGGASSMEELTDVDLTDLEDGDVLVYDEATETWLPQAPAAGGGGGGDGIADTVGQLEIANTVTETTLYTYSVPGGTLSTTKALALNLIGDWINNTGADQTVRLRVKYGATTLHDETTAPLPPSAMRRAWMLNLQLGNTGTASSQFAAISWLLGNAQAGAVGLGDASVAMHQNHLGAGSSAEDSTVAQALTVTIELSTASANLSYRRQNAYLFEILSGSGGGASSGTVAQVVNVQTGAAATGTTAIPLDDTIPQITEGTEFMTLAITPTSATNKLRIDVVFYATHASAGWVLVALFQGTTANALATFANYQNIGTGQNACSFTHYMTAGTTSPTTFRVRAGPDHTSPGTITFNGMGGTRRFGGTFASSITITEIAP